MAVGSGGGNDGSNTGGGSSSGGTGPGAGGGWGGGANNNQGSGGSMGSSGSGPSGGGGWGGHGGGGGNGGNGGNSGQGSSNKGISANESQGRRDSATSAFGGLTDSETGIGNLADAAAVGVGAKDRGMSELGEVGWSGPGHTSREAAANLGQKRGAQMSVDASGLQSVGNLAGGLAGLGVKGFTEAAERGMTADEARGYQDVQGQKTGLASWGGTAVGMVAGPAVGAMTNLGITAVDHARQASYAQSRYGINVSEGRRDTASKSFSGNSGSGRPGSLTGSQTTSPTTGWQPSTIGFGEYDSHLKGLLA